MNHMNQFLFYAVVTNNQDPMARARIKARLSLAGEQVETDWIPTVQPYASGECGTLILPEVGDQVVIAFFDDTLSQGVVLGGVWNDSRPAPESGENSAADFNGDGENNLRFFRSRSGNRIILDDTAGAEKLQLLSPDGASRFEILPDQELINLESAGDITIAAGGNLLIEAETIRVEASSSMEIACQDLAMSADSGDLSLDASGSLGVDAREIALN